ncbi:MAG TPA: hypothetical protein VMF70_12905 [Gemmatimonadales bacterium]|nr:hypothetical protein [Gemmatimonadales bacterium]
MFANITDIDAGYIVAGSPIANHGTVTGSLNGVAMEVLFGLGTVAGTTCPKAGQPLAHFIVRRLTADRDSSRTVGDSSRTVRGPSRTVLKDTTDTIAARLAEIRVLVRQSGTDTTRVYVPDTAAMGQRLECRRSSLNLEGELGLEYSRLGGFRSSGNLRATVDELPTVSFYLNLNLPGPGSHFIPYLGVHAGLAQLTNTQASPDTNSSYTAAGNTIQVGGAIGFAFSLGGWALFVEYDRTYQTFDGISWSAPTAAGATPSTLPRTLNLSAETFSMGGQIRFGKAGGGPQSGH